LDVSTELVVVGHFAIDNIYHDGRFLGKFLGGPPAYVSLAASKLGVRVSVLSKVGGDFSEEYLKFLIRNNVDLSFLKQIKKAETTKFMLQYSAGWRRRLRLEKVAPPIQLKDLPKNLRAKAIHVAPIANEVENETIPALKKNSEILSLDPQGFTREFDKNGNMRLKAWKKPRLMRLFNVYKSSFDEIKMITGASSLEKAMKKISGFGVEIVLVTLGAEGSAILFGSKYYRVPPVTSKRVKDVTGAGDVYIGGFLAEYVRGKDIPWCACVGSAVASFAVEELGFQKFVGRKAVYERASEVYEEVFGKRN